MLNARLRYIDAMRGFTMILVVYSHICNYCLGDRMMGYNDVFFLFRLPCFFFISGWLFEPVRQSSCLIVKKKFRVQIVPTIIFLLILAPPPLFFTRLGALKGGYWFTFALFVFFLIYLFSCRYCRQFGGLLAFVLSISAYVYDAYYNRYFSQMGGATYLLGFISFITWRYYLFFYLGTLVKRYFDTYFCYMSKYYVNILVLAVFILFANLPHSNSVLFEYLIFCVGGLSGVVAVFMAFRYLETWLLLHPACWGGNAVFRSLQYVGTRTLDIYLLHYFFLPRFLLIYGEQLRSYGCKPIELVVALSLSLVVLVLCLVVSYIIRLSPFLGHNLFGVNYEKT